MWHVRILDGYSPPLALTFEKCDRSAIVLPGRCVALYAARDRVKYNKTIHDRYLAPVRVDGEIIYFMGIFRIAVPVNTFKSPHEIRLA